MCPKFEGNRDKMQILGEMLNLANGGIIRNHLRSSLGLDSNQLDRYLAMAKNLGYIDESYEKYTTSYNEKPAKSRLVYRTTFDGLRYLSVFNPMMRMLEGDEYVDRLGRRGADTYRPRKPQDEN